MSDRDIRFTNKFWRSLHQRLGVKLQMLTAFHLQTDGRNEKTNKTVLQVLHNLISRTQKDWVRHLSQTEFAINAAVNESTGVSPFEMVLGFVPQIHPRIAVPAEVPLVEDILAECQAGITAPCKELAASKICEAE